MMAGEWKPAVPARACTFCPCALRVPIPQAFHVCACPCHWRDNPLQANYLSAVRHFFGKELGAEAERDRILALLKAFGAAAKEESFKGVIAELVKAVEEGKVAR